MGARWDDLSVRPDWLERENLHRQVIAKPEGWVLRRNINDASGNNMQREEVLVAAGDLANTVGLPRIGEIYVANSSGGSTLRRNLKSYVAAVFNEALLGAAANLRLTVANTASGNSCFARANNTIGLANNTVYFSFTPNTAGTYKVQAQTIANTAGAVTLRAEQRVESANLVITAGVSNTLGTFTVV